MLLFLLNDTLINLVEASVLIVLTAVVDIDVLVMNVLFASYSANARLYMVVSTESV